MNRRRSFEELPAGSTSRPIENHHVRGEPGVNLIGWPRLQNGMGEYLREIARALTVNHLPFGIKDVSEMPSTLPGDDSVSTYVRQNCAYNTNLYVVNADNMKTTCDLLGSETVEARFNVALWAWELSEFPNEWCQAMDIIDEIWAFSSFSQESLASKATIPVLSMRQPVTLAAGPHLSRVDFGIPENRYVFLFQFDFTAFIDRKNPYGCIAAFRKAFPHDRSDVLLVIKTNNSEKYPEPVEATCANGRRRPCYSSISRRLSARQNYLLNVLGRCLRILTSFRGFRAVARGSNAFRQACNRDQLFRQH